MTTTVNSMDIKFATKIIRYNDTQKSILLQNENGPCALIALINVLLIDPRYTDTSQELTDIVQKSAEVSLESMLQSLAGILLKEPQTSNDDTGCSINEKTGDASSVSKCLTLLPELHTGLNVNPIFDGGFKESIELSLFRLLDIDLVHGWVLEDSTPDAFRLQSLSYDEAIDLCTHASDVMTSSSTSLQESSENILKDAQNLQTFFDESPTQLTTSGIQLLQKKLSNNRLAVLFRNDHFATVLNHDGILFALVTDLGYKKKTNIVWESLLTIDGSGNSYFDSNFQESQYEADDAPISDRNSHSENYNADHQIALQLQSEEDNRLAKSLEQTTTNTDRKSHGHGKKEKDSKKNKSRSKSKPKKHSPKTTPSKNVSNNSNKRSSTSSKSSKDSCVIV